MKHQHLNMQQFVFVHFSESPFVSPQFSSRRISATIGAQTPDHGQAEGRTRLGAPSRAMEDLDQLDGAVTATWTNIFDAVGQLMWFFGSDS